LATGHGIFGYFVLPARVDGACFGVITALVVRSERALRFLRMWRSQIWLVIAALFTGAGALSVIGQGIGSLGAGIYTHLALAAASSLTIAVLISKPEGMINQALRFQPLVWLGSISYGVYLIHIPAIGVAHAVMGRTSAVLDSWSAVVATVVGIGATIGLAWLSWRYFEKPLNDHAHRLTKGNYSSDLPTATLLPNATHRTA
jgi:peptidoglycan/LPS O-acetylase OafA/YrhL